MRLGTKIIIGFICISLLLAIIDFITNSYTSEIRQEQLRSVNEASEVVIYTGDMERSLYQSLIFLNGIREAQIAEKNYETIQELPAVVRLEAKFQEELVKFEQAFEKAKQVISQDRELPEDFDKLIKSYSMYKNISKEWLELGEEETNQRNLMFINSIEPYFRGNIIPEISRMRTYVLTLQEKRNATLVESLNKANLINYIATFISVLLAVVLAIYIYRSIANPLSRLSNVAKKIGEGKLDEHLNINSKDEIGELAQSINSMAVNLQNKTVSTAYLDNIIESIQEALLVTDNNGVLVRANSAAADLLGYDIEEMLGESLDRYYDRDKLKDASELSNGSATNSLEIEFITKDEDTVPVLFSKAKLLDHQGKQVGTVSVASDISSRIRREDEIRNSLKEKEVMLAEIHHRVKNNLAVISGLLQLQSFSAESENVRSALSDSQLRIQSIALVHEMLYESESLAYIQYDQYVKDLLQAISSMYINSEKNIEFVTDLETISLTVNQAIPCSMLLNELIVNSFKHAFTDEEEGEIRVRMIEAEGQVSIYISDNGKDFDLESFDKADSLGATLIRTLVKQLKADFEVLDLPDEEGVAFKIQFDREQ